MASINEINHLYHTYLGGASPSQSDYDYWTNAGFTGDNLYNTFQGVARNDPRYSAPNRNAGGGIGNPQDSIDYAQLQQMFDTGMGGFYQGLEGLGMLTNQGFMGMNENMNNQFNMSNQLQGARFDQMGQNMNQGFNQTNENLSTGFTGLSGQMNQNFDNLGQGVQTGFNSLNEANDARSQAQKDYMDQLNASIMGGLGNLGSNLDQVGSNLNTYYGDLSSGQQGMQSSLDTLGSDLGDFRDTYDTRTNAADRTRQQMMDSIAGTSAQTRSALMGRMDELGQQMGGGGGGPQGMGAPTGTSGGSSYGGVPVGGQGSPQQQQGFINTLNTARQILGSNQNLNPSVGMQLGEFVSAFDNSGQFISNGPDLNGQNTARAITPQGEMAIAKQSQDGQFRHVGSLDLNTVQQLIQQLAGGM